MKKILLTGASGLVASRFVELYLSKYQLLTPEYPKFDITNLDVIKKYLDKNSPEVIINFAAFTDVNAAESQRDDKNGLSWKVNVEGPNNLLKAISGNNTEFIQISTDMVFSGSSSDKGPYGENHPIEQNMDKLTWYGYTKGIGEIAPTIVRIIYPVRAKYEAKMDYLHGSLAKFDKGELKSMFADQQISITFIDELCEALTRIIDNNMKGIFHVASSDITTPYELVSYLVEKMRGEKNAFGKSFLKDLIDSGKIPSYRYPLYGGLDSKKTQEKLDMKFRSIKEIVSELIKQDFI